MTPERDSARAPGISKRETLPDDGSLLILDGGLATELEERGHDLDHPLWSAHLLETAPDAIREVHRDYLEAGADCIIAASYQASLPGLATCGYSADESREILEKAVSIAIEERDAFVDRQASDSTRRRPLVAASIGPYGAYLADGSEFRGRYGLSRTVLKAFHRERMDLLWQAGPDLLAIETLPCAEELEVLLELLAEAPGRRAWISFSCRDSEHINDGTPIRDCARLCAANPGVWAVGVNCTAPQYVSALIDQIRSGAPGLRIVVYPNSGEDYDGEKRAWVGHSDPVDYGRSALEWQRLGASILGGCCRTRPQHIREIRSALGL